MDCHEFNSYTLRELNALIEREATVQRRRRDIPAAQICATIANMAGKTSPNTEWEYNDFLLMPAEEAEEIHFRRMDERMRQSLVMFHEKHKGETEP